jgi:hypothetical protein
MLTGKLLSPVLMFTLKLKKKKWKTNIIGHWQNSKPSQTFVQQYQYVGLDKVDLKTLESNCWKNSWPTSLIPPIDRHWPSYIPTFFNFLPHFKVVASQWLETDFSIPSPDLAKGPSRDENSLILHSCSNASCCILFTLGVPQAILLIMATPSWILRYPAHR